MAPTAIAVTTTATTPASHRLIGAPRPGSVPGAGLRAPAVERVQPALLGERLAGLGDVVGELVRERVAERQLDERAHDRDVLGVRRQGVSGPHPAALGGELRRDVEL